MDEQEMAAVLAEMADRRIAALRASLRDQIALKLFNEHGTVEASAVDEQFARQWREPDLGDQLAAKCVAAVTVERDRLQLERAELDRAYAKLEKAKETAAALVESAQNEVHVAELGEELAAAEQRLRDAEQLAEYAQRRGDPDRSAAGTSTKAFAGAATGKAAR